MVKKTKIHEIPGLPPTDPPDKPGLPKSSLVWLCVVFLAAAVIGPIVAWETGKTKGFQEGLTLHQTVVDTLAIRLHQLETRRRAEQKHCDDLVKVYQKQNVGLAEALTVARDSLGEKGWFELELIPMLRNGEWTIAPGIKYTAPDREWLFEPSQTRRRE